jgi:hypothetical protein
MGPERTNVDSLLPWRGGSRFVVNVVLLTSLFLWCSRSVYSLNYGLKFTYCSDMKFSF